MRKEQKEQNKYRKYRCDKTVRRDEPINNMKINGIVRLPQLSSKSFHICPMTVRTWPNHFFQLRQLDGLCLESKLQESSSAQFAVVAAVLTADSLKPSQYQHKFTFKSKFMYI